MDWGLHSKGKRRSCKISDSVSTHIPPDSLIEREEKQEVLIFLQLTLVTSHSTEPTGENVKNFVNVYKDHPSTAKKSRAADR